MKSKALCAVSFIFGVMAGSIPVWVHIKNKYEKISREEIESVKVFYKSKYESVKQNQNPISKTISQEPDKSVMEYASLLNKEQYVDYSTTKVKKIEEVEKPYIIEPEEFGELSNYTTVSLTLYSNNVLVDENEEPVDDIDDTIGSDSLTHFGEYEDDSVFVRNDRYKCDYEILRSLNEYGDKRVKPNVHVKIP